MPELNATHVLLDRLTAIPEHLAHAVKGSSETDLHIRREQGAWSVAEIFAHIRAADAIVSPRCYAIIVRDHTPLVAYDERRWAEVAGYAQADFSTSLALFTLHRAELVNMLRRLAPADWQRVGVHEELGSQSLLTILTAFVEHEEEHCAQILAIYT